MKITYIKTVSDYYTLDPKIIGSLFDLDQIFHQTYQNSDLDYKEWNKSIEERLHNNIQYLIISKNESVLGYGAFLEDDKYENIYVKNLTVDTSEGFSPTVLKILMREIMLYFLDSKFMFMRFSTHRRNNNMITMCEKYGLTNIGSLINEDYITYEITKDNLKKLPVYKMMKRSSHIV